MPAKGFDLARLLAAAAKQNVSKPPTVEVGGARLAGLERELARSKALQNMTGRTNPDENAAADALRVAREAAVKEFSSAPEFAAEQFGRNLDWGFVSPDPNSGVITASMMRKLYDRMDSAQLSANRYRDVDPNYLTVLNRKAISSIETPARAGLRRPVTDQYEIELERLLASNADNLDAPEVNRLKSRAAAARAAIVKTFYPMEYAGIPREWTGAVSKALPEDITPSSSRYVSYVREVSNALRDMTNDQRMLFLDQLKNWRGPVDQLAEFVMGGM